MTTPYQAVTDAVRESLPDPVNQGGEDRAITSSKPAGPGSAGGWDRSIEPLLSRIAASELPILVAGETGTGKEVVARRIHALSPRANEAFVKLTCAAISVEFVEGALPWHDQGASIEAHGAGPLPFDLADRCTVLLDEIGDMELKIQAKLLHILENGHFPRLNANQPARVDVRVIATTRHSLATKVAVGAFREDLYYRLKVFSITIPPLRERQDEIIPLAGLFLNRHNRSADPPPPIGPELSMALVHYSWPGNIRELENAMRSYLIVRDPQLLIDELRDFAVRTTAREPQTVVAEKDGVLRIASGPKESQQSLLERVYEVRKNAETELILNALSSAYWNRKRAATALGMDYRAFLYKMKKLGIMQLAHVK